MAPSETAGAGAGAPPSGERLQKVMAAAGIASRRVSEDLIAQGRVTVNGAVVTEPGRRIDPVVDRVVVDGQAVQLDTSRRYLMLNKPVGVVSSLRDERGRPDLTQFTDRYPERLFNVGRLDAETSGLLILTNDGELAHVLAHPSFGVMKTYVAKVEGSITPATVKTLLAGVELEDGPIAADSARIVDRGTGRASGTSIVEITLHSGRNRIVRRMLDAVGHPVIDLVRRQFGPLHLGTLKIGQARDLTRDELGELLTIAQDAGLGAVATAVVAEADEESGVHLVADVEDDVAETDKEYYDEDDEEFEAERDARDESRRRPAGAGRGSQGDQQGGTARREPKKQYDSDGNRRRAVNGDVTGGRPVKGDGPTSRRAEVRREQERRRGQERPGGTGGRRGGPGGAR
ncbi:pseudouridine synthase [Frondihabitans australicus]|uniref:Pseudouridine synthase n=1 Tax=Frondihabitans australicus TaxID=386892 RepID=A0A495IGJ7_9MICO|nr:pseudouridine synthase [Frondihabitans australicus]